MYPDLRYAEIEYVCKYLDKFFKSNYIASKDVNAWLCCAQVIK